MTLHEYFNVTSDEDRSLDASVVDLCKAFVHFFSKYLHAFVDSRRGFMLQALQPTDPSIFKVFSLFLGLRKSRLQYHNFHVPFLVSLVKMFGNLSIVWSILDIMPVLTESAGEGASSLTHTNGIVPSTDNSVYQIGRLTISTSFCFYLYVFLLVLVVVESLYPRNLIFALGVRKSLSPRNLVPAKLCTNKVP